MTICFSEYNKLRYRISERIYKINIKLPTDELGIVPSSFVFLAEVIIVVVIFIIAACVFGGNGI